jgi:hypothetical protein
VSGNKTEEIGISNLALSQPSLAEQFEALRKQTEILKTMHGVISDHRDNVHAQSSSMIPEPVSAPVPQPKGTGWAKPVPLEPPPGVAQCDRLVDAFEEEERRSKK